MLRTGHKARNEKTTVPSGRQLAKPHLCASQNSVCAGIVARAALFSAEGWDAFLRRQPLQTLSFTFGSRFILGRNQLGIAAQTATLPMISPPPAGGRCSRWDRCRNGNGKSDGNRRTLLPSSRSESVGALLPTTPGGLAHAVELRGFRLAARGRTYRFRSSTGDERPFQGDPKGLDVELSNPGSRQNGSPATSRWNRGRD